jgi:hypothetical protein
MQLFFLHPLLKNKLPGPLSYSKYRILHLFGSTEQVRKTNKIPDPILQDNEIACPPASESAKEYLQCFFDPIASFFHLLFSYYIIFFAKNDCLLGKKSREKRKKKKGTGQALSPIFIQLCYFFDAEATLEQLSPSPL